MANKIKPGMTPEPENPCAEPGSFVIRGKAWYDEYGEMVIDEDGEIPWDIKGYLAQFENFLYEEDEFRQDGTPRSKAIPKYELKWCPIAEKPKKPRKR